LAKEEQPPSSLLTSPWRNVHTRKFFLTGGKRGTIMGRLFPACWFIFFAWFRFH
jgi:hypothetical protein